MSLQNKVVLVTGANRGIGAALVRALLEANVAKVYAAARSVASLPDLGDRRVVPLQLDVTSDTSVTTAAGIAQDLDILVNNAGTMAFGDWVSATPDAVEGDMNVNYHGTLRVVRAFLPHLIRRGSGIVANVVSIVGLEPVPGLAGYSASKAALQSLTQGLRGTLAKSGVAVVGIYPGPVDTDLARNLPLEKASPDEAAANIVRGLAEGRTSIFPDPTAQQIGQLWAQTGPHLEAALQVGG
jgi:NAD(P)-dependent dehydrogenase (short-subunit alcohol dehydrogenase family)